MRRPVTAVHHERRGAGPPLLLVHGLGSELCVWEPVLDRLAADYDVIAVDLPGFGRSAPLPDGATPTPGALARALAELLDALEIDRAHLAGNSLGAWVALELALQGRARSVTGICPAGLWGAPLISTVTPETGRAQRLARRARPLLPLLMADPRLRRLVLAPFVADPSKVPYHAAWRMVSSYGRATAYAATSTAMRSGHFAAMADVEVPVTLAFGAADRLIRPVRLPRVRTVVLQHSGHIAMWDEPARVARVIDETASGAEADRAAAARYADATAG